MATSYYSSWNHPETLQKTLKVDAIGYYSYLPAFFIHKDVKFEYYSDILKSDSIAGKQPYNFVEATPKGDVNKYYIGTALAELPFFLPVYTYYAVQNLQSTGYENTYQFAIHLSAIFYALLGCIFCVKILDLFSIKRGWSYTIIYALILGTNFGYIVESEPGLSHIFSFCFISIFLYCMRLIYMGNQEQKWRLLAGLSFGMILLIRPINLIILASLPFISGSFLLLFSKQNLKNYLYIAFIGALVFSIQFLYYYAATGHPFIYSYNEEGFNFLQPEITNFLWSYRKGFFMFTPVFIFMIFGVIQWYLKRDKAQAIYFTLFFIFLTYVFSSWWLWYYGGGLGTRVFVEFYPLFIIPTAWFFQQIKRPFIKSLSILIFAASIYFGYITQWQYRKGKLHWDSITKEQYLDNLFKIDQVL